MSKYFTDSYIEKQMMQIPKHPKKQYSIFVKKSFKSPSHKSLYEREIQHYQKQGFALTNRFAAALYLLTSDFFMWKSSKYNIKANYIDFNSIDIKGADTRSYIIYKAAKDIIYKTTSVAFSDIIELTVTNDELFSILLVAMYISRYGIEVIETDKS